MVSITSENLRVAVGAFQRVFTASLLGSDCEEWLGATYLWWLTKSTREQMALCPVLFKLGYAEKFLTLHLVCDRELTSKCGVSYSFTVKGHCFTLKGHCHFLFLNCSSCCEWCLRLLLLKEITVGKEWEGKPAKKLSEITSCILLAMFI